MESERERKLLKLRDEKREKRAIGIICMLNCTVLLVVDTN